MEGCNDKERKNAGLNGKPYIYFKKTREEEVNGKNSEEHKRKETSSVVTPPCLFSSVHSEKIEFLYKHAFHLKTEMHLYFKRDKTKAVIKKKYHRNIQRKKSI